MWICTHCGQLSFHGIAPLCTLGAEATAKLKALIAGRIAVSASRPDDDAAWAELPYFDTPPKLVQEPTRPPGLRLFGNSNPDTVALLALVGADGKVHGMTFERSYGDRDSLVAAMLRSSLYRPAFQGDRPVKALLELRVAVPRKE